MSTRSDEELERNIAARLARRLEESSKSMAWILAKYREAEGLEESMVAQRLGVDVHELHRLARFGRPRPYLFAEDIETISEETGIEQQQLASMVRHVEALETFRYHSAGGSDQFVAAARDVAEEQETYDAESDNSESTPSIESDEEE